jgi:hypothetical protein
MKIRILFGFSVVAAFLLGAFSIKMGLTFSDVARAQLAPSPIPIKICEGASAIPLGWIATDAFGDATCVYPAASVITGRMLTIESYAQAQKIGNQMTVCADAPVPAGFVVEAFGKVPTKCALITSDPNATPSDHMVKIIQYIKPMSVTPNKKSGSQP